MPHTLQALPADLDSRVLLGSPDILQAEHALIASNANIGAARAAFFPSISLTGAIGTLIRSVPGLFDNRTGHWNFQPAVNIARHPCREGVCESVRTPGCAGT